MGLSLETLVCSEEKEFLKKSLNFAFNSFRFLFKGFSIPKMDSVPKKQKQKETTGI